MEFTVPLRARTVVAGIALTVTGSLALSGCGSLPSTCWWGTDANGVAIYCTDGTGYNHARAQYPTIPVHGVPKRY